MKFYKCPSILLLCLLATVAKGQLLASKYVDDRINEMTYLHFRSDSTFKFKYAYDSIGDEASGTYRLHKDTLILKYNPNDPQLKDRFLIHTEAYRADTLLVKGRLLYEVKNNISREYEPRDTLHQKPLKHWGYRRKYFLFGVYQSPRYSKYYMIDERYASWLTRSVSK
jgi:hypothetical protein